MCIIAPVLQIGKLMTNQWKDLAEVISAGGRARHQTQELPVPLHS